MNIFNLTAQKYDEGLKDPPPDLSGLNAQTRSVIEELIQSGQVYPRDLVNVVACLEQLRAADVQIDMLQCGNIILTVSGRTVMFAVGLILMGSRYHTVKSLIDELSPRM